MSNKTIPYSINDSGKQKIIIHYLKKKSHCNIFRVCLSLSLFIRICTDTAMKATSVRLFHSIWTAVDGGQETFECHVILCQDENETYCLVSCAAKAGGYFTCACVARAILYKMHKKKLSLLRILINLKKIYRGKFFAFQDLLLNAKLSLMYEKSKKAKEREIDIMTARLSS